jgi:N-acetylmuramoyl-L-alanine amidase
VANPTLQLLTDEATLEAVVQKSLQDTIGAATEAFVDTGVMQDLADKKEAERKAAEEAARKKAEEEARKKAEAAKKKEAKILATAQKYINESGVKISAKDLLLMARTIYFEANAEPYAGKVAVANVILNRVEKGYADKTIHGVVYQKNAFSVVRRSNFATKAPNDACYRAAIEALQGRREVPKNCYWFVSTSVKSCWASKHCTLYKTIGTHRFYVK